MRICVLGAGIVGLATAWHLHRLGHEVCVIDRHEPGLGSSAGNGGQLSYSYVAPLADPGIWAQIPQLLLSPDSPLTLRPRLDPAQWSWIARFLLACKRSTAEKTTAHLLALAAESRAGFEKMLVDVQPDCDFMASGKLVIYDSQSALDSARHQMELQQALGSRQTLMNADECAQVEPALLDYQHKFSGGIYTPSECAADCLKVCRDLAKTLRMRGVTFLTPTEIQGFDTRQGRIAAVRTSSGNIESDAFVVALGVGSHAIGRKLGVSLPLYPLKGYSITVNVDSTPAAAPRVSITDSARKVVFARLGNRLRVAGNVEIVGHDNSIPTRRIDALISATRALFPRSGATFESPQAWTGMRPATPTGVPIIGRVPGAPTNALFNTGHGALGFTLAFGTASRLAQQL